MNIVKSSKSSFLWDLWCIVSIIGIWPRFVEPNIISTTRISLKIPKLASDLQGIKILQLSDLHLHERVSDSFLEKILQKVLKLQPDIIVCTGDFICNGVVRDKERLRRFLNSFHAPYGCYAILGNHDYEQFISVNARGDYDIIEQNNSPLKKAFKRLFSTTHLTKKVTERAQKVPPHPELVQILETSPFQFLHNVTRQVKIKNTLLNICGLGEHTVNKTYCEEAFDSYDKNYAGIILTHNPDSIPYLQAFPGDVILCGHTHGGQVNLPWMWKKFTLLENMQYKRGLFHLQEKWAYINRGLGSMLPFRWFAKPEILLLTLE